jgi:hypothetical protein
MRGVSPGGAAPASVRGGGGVRWSNCGWPLPTHVGEAVRGDSLNERKNEMRNIVNCCKAQLIF